MSARRLTITLTAALLLTGCSGAGTTADQPTAASSSPASASAETAVKPDEAQSAPSPASEAAVSEEIVNSGQDWADSKIQMWVDNSGIKSTKGFLYPYNLMTSWTSPEPGVIDIKISNDYVFNKDGMMEPYQNASTELNVFGLIMFESIGEQSPELETVTVSTENGKYSGTYTRGRTGADPHDRKAWAQEKYQQWFISMRDTYESFCHSTLEKLTDYRDCLPTDPHAYISKVESPKFGELVVTLDDGPWIDGEYDSPGADFVSSNMIIRINDRNTGDGKVEKLTVLSKDGTETSEALSSQWQ